MVKEGIIDMETEPNVVEEAITSTILEKTNIGTVNKTEKSQSSNKTVDAPNINKTDTVKSIDKSRSTQITDIFNTVDKTSSIPGNILYIISTIIEEPTEIDIVKDKKDLSDLSLHGSDLSGIAPDIIHVPRKIKVRKLQTL